MDDEEKISTFQPNIIPALVIKKSPSGKIKILSDERVLLKRTESGRLKPMRLDDIEISDADSGNNTNQQLYYNQNNPGPSHYVSC